MPFAGVTCNSAILGCNILERSPLLKPVLLARCLFVSLTQHTTARHPELELLQTKPWAACTEGSSITKELLLVAWYERATIGTRYNTHLVCFNWQLRHVAAAGKLTRSPNSKPYITIELMSPLSDHLDGPKEHAREQPSTALNWAYELELRRKGTRDHKEKGQNSRRE